MGKRIDIDSICPDAFSNIDKRVDNFAKTSNVSSKLLYGTQRETSPWLTVIIPTYNRKKLFYQTLKSVLEQDRVPYTWEIIVMDNSELDKNGETPALSIVKTLKAENVKLYHNSQNLGSGYNWNRGVELACGEWICFLHDDDILCQDALRQIGRLLMSGRKSTHGLGYLSARRMEFREDGNICRSASFGQSPQEVLTRLGVLLCGHTSAGAPTCGTTILKKAYMEAGGINYDFGPSADAVLCYQIMKNYTVVNSDCILGGYRWSDNAMLNVESLLNCIRADDLLMHYVYEQSKFAQLWGKWFADAISWRNVWRKNNIARTYHKEISREDFEKASLYPEPSEVKKSVYLVMYAIYRALRYLASYIATALNRIRIQTDD